MLTVQFDQTLRLNAEPYFRPTHLGPDCSSDRNARLREHRVRMSYLKLSTPEEYSRLADEARLVYLKYEEIDPSLARARALEHIVENCPITIEPDTLFLGGENPFFFNLLLPALRADRYQRESDQALDPAARRLRDAAIYAGPCFDGHITPGLEYILGLGMRGYRGRVEEFQRILSASHTADRQKEHFYQAALISCESIGRYTERYRLEAERLASESSDPEYAAHLREAAQVLGHVPFAPAETLREAMQSYWIAYTLVTLEMGGATPGGGLGLGRLDQYLYPFYQRDLAAGRITRTDALELLEQFLLNFSQVDYYTEHQMYTTGSQSSLGGITPTGQDGFNELTELIMEASLRINMPTPYISLRLYEKAPERFWQAAANYIASGLGFPVVNDEVLIPAMLRHGRSLSDARDYICSCCYEHTIPGREAFHPSCIFINMPFVLELALNQGRSVLTGAALGCATPAVEQMTSFADVMAAFQTQIHYVLDLIVAATNRADEMHSAYRRYPLMSLFIDDCLAEGQDVCAGGARYNLTGCVMAGLPNLVNSLAGLQQAVFTSNSISLPNLVKAMRANFQGHETLQRKLLAAPKWGNDQPVVDTLASEVADFLYSALSWRKNARGGRWQLALYSFVINYWFGSKTGASADGRLAGQMHTRNLNPTWGSDRKGPTAVLNSLSHIDFTTAPDGSSLDLRFDPGLFATPELRQTWTAYLKTFVRLGVMEMQISVVDTDTLLDARAHPERYPHLLVRVAGYSARFIDLSEEEKDELIGRSLQKG